ncbi:hypothetical protein BU15DRAFT_57763, partial [Melanogaster broomeanus]
KLGIEPLKTLSFMAIETRLSKANILHEAFSRFTAMFPEIQEMEISMLLDNRKAPEVLQALPDKILAISLGKMPHAVPTLTTFCQRMADK